MDSMHWEQQETVVLKREKLRKGSPLVIASRSGEQRSRSEADDLRSKFEQPLRESREQEQASSLLAAAEQQARELLEMTKRDAARILEEATAEAGRMREEAAAESSRRLEAVEPQLREQLEVEYRSRFAEAIAAVGNAADALERGRTELLASLELPAFELVTHLARRLLLAELERSPQYLTGLIRSALGLLNEGREVSLRLSPQITALIESDEQFRDALHAGRRRGQSISIEADANLSGSAFRLLTDGGEVAFDLEETLATLDELLTRRFFPAQLDNMAENADD